MNCLIYARVSTDRQADKELSIPAQLQACRQYARQRDWTIIEEIVEPGISARTVERPGLQAMLAKCRASEPKVGAVLVHKIDRLTRNLADHVAIRGILRERQIALASVVEQLDESNSGILVEHIMASLAEFYSANLSEEVKKGLRQKIQQGGWPHLPPVGYRAMDRRVAVDPNTSVFVRHAFEIYGRGDVTLHRLSRRLEQDGRRFSVSGLQRLLRNPFYKGELRWNGGSFPGRHEPLVTDELFSRVQAVLDNRTRRLRSSPKCNLWLRGFARCSECGSLMASEAHDPHLYYRCRRSGAKRDPCRAKFCNAKRSDGQVLELYERIRLVPAVRRSLLTTINAQVDQEVRCREQEVAALQTRLGQIDKRAVDLATSFADGLVEPDVYRLAAQRIQDDRASFSERLRQLPVEQPGRSVASEARTLAEFHATLSLDLQQHLLTLLFSNLTLHPAGIASYELRPPFDVLDSNEQPNAYECDQSSRQSQIRPLP